MSCESICEHRAVCEEKSGFHGHSPCAWCAHFVMPEVQRFCKVTWGFTSVWVLRPFIWWKWFKWARITEGLTWGGSGDADGHRRCPVQKLFLLMKSAATDSSLRCLCTSWGCKLWFWLFLSEWEWVILEPWVFRGSDVLLRGSRTRCWSSMPWHKGRKLKGILGGDISVPQGI